MKRATWWTLSATTGLALVASLGLAGSPRDYIAAPGALTCVDAQFTLLGLGGQVGAALNQAGDTLDPILPDIGGTCYRPGHLVPFGGNDVTIFTRDDLRFQVGLCVSQDADGNGVLCDDGDPHGCNAVTLEAFPLGPFRPDRLTWVLVDSLPSGVQATGTSACPEGDSFGTRGFIDHM